MRKILKNAVLTFLLLVLGFSTALLAYLHFHEAGEDDLSGEWTAELNMTDQATVMAYGWLQDIEGVSVSPELVEAHMQELTIQVMLKMEQTDRSSGEFQCSILPDSYEACNQAAYEAFAECFRELTGERLHMAGYAGDTDQEAVEALVARTFGMSTVSYLMSCAPALLPSLEELQAQYDGSGAYETGEGILTRRFEDDRTVDTRQEYYLRQGGELVLTDGDNHMSSGVFFDPYPVIYRLETVSE